MSVAARTLRLGISSSPWAATLAIVSAPACGRASTRNAAHNNGTRSAPAPPTSNNAAKGLGAIHCATGATVPLTLPKRESTKPPSTPAWIGTNVRRVSMSTRALRPSCQRMPHT